MADALVSPPVAVAAGAVAAALVVTAAAKVRSRQSPSSIATMGVMGAFIFAAQMLNFSIPGTGSSGHIVGGVLLAAMLGPWAALLTLVCVLVIQCLLFADGGLMALGCNIINMGATTCLVAYPLVFRPLTRAKPTPLRLGIASVASCVAGLALGAFLVTVETEASGVTALPFSRFLLFMLPIHLVIGAVEGIATAAVLYFVYKSQPSLLYRPDAVAQPPQKKASRRRTALVIGLFAIAAVAAATVVSRWASSDPDGLEWSIERVTGTSDLEAPAESAHRASAAIQSRTAAMPDYDNRLAGLTGALLCVGAASAVCAMLARRRRHAASSSDHSST